MSFGVTNVAGLLMFRVNCSSSCANDIGVQLLLLGVARSTIFSIPIAVRNPCCSVVMSSRFYVMLCVIRRSEISMVVLFRCCSKLKTQQLYTIDVATVGSCSGPHEQVEEVVYHYFDSNRRSLGCNPQSYPLYICVEQV